MDEIAISPRARWSPSNNEIVGFCYNHKKTIQSWKFNNFLKVKLLENKFTNKEIFLAKETLVISICGINNVDCIPKPVYLLPICCKQCDLLEEIVKKMITIFEEKNPCACLLNIATDGDSFRRCLFDENRLQLKNEEIYSALSQLRFFNTETLLGKLSINYDVKHLI